MSERATPKSPDRCPVAFDQHAPEHVQSWPQVFRDLREQCPRIRSDRYGGFWVATKYKDIVNIAQSKDNFSSAKRYDPVTGKVEGGLALPGFATQPSKPSESDSPEWDGLRTFLNSRFSPKAVEQYRSQVKHLTAALVDRFIENGRFDIVDDLTNPLPSLVTMAFLGLPLHEWKIFSDALHKQVYLSQDDPEFPKVIEAVEYFRQRVEDEIRIRREQRPSDDMMGYFAAGKIDGKLLDLDLIKNMAVNILEGGVSTTMALTSNALLHLSRHPDQRQRLIDEPELLPRACEEFLRYFTPIPGTARTAKEDATIDNWQFEKGDRVLLAFASANRDGEIFEDPEEVKLERAPNRHIAFGAGMHRCLGSFLARMMFQAMVTEVLTRLPDYSVVESDIKRPPRIGYLNAWISMPATFTPGAKVGAVIA